MFHRGAMRQFSLILERMPATCDLNAYFVSDNIFSELSSSDRMYTMTILI